jgi:hypothetical protein
MRKKILLTLITSLVFILIGCTKESDCTFGKSDSKVVSITPIDRATHELQLLISELYGASKPTNNLILQVFGSGSLHKGEGDVLETPMPDTLLYFVNFEDGNGFAVISALSGADPKVLCITETGRLTKEDLIEAYDSLCAYPPETTETDTTSHLRTYGTLYVPMTLIATVLNQLRDISSGNEDYPDDINDEVYETTTHIGPLLNTKWTQWAPFNNFRDDGAPAGCVAIATAQILEYNRQENPNETNFDWDLLATVYPDDNPSSNGTWEAQQEASRLSQYVGRRKNCYIRYSTDGSSGFAAGAKRTFVNFDYSSVNKRCGYNTNRKNQIIAQLTEGLPVYMDGSRHGGGHAWVIDGLHVRKVYTPNNEFIRTDNLFHINWGWRGSYDGYFAQGTFNITSSIEIDPSKNRLTKDSESYNYTFNYRVITYSL